MLISIPTWTSNHIPCKVWDEITYLFPNFNGMKLKHSFGRGWAMAELWVAGSLLWVQGQTCCPSFVTFALCTVSHYHWKQRVVMMPTLSSLVMTKLASWQLSAFNDCQWYNITLSLKPRVVMMPTLSSLVMTKLASWQLSAFSDILPCYDLRSQLHQGSDLELTVLCLQ